MTQRTLQFYPREIFVIFSLFVFTSLLMFTVGIVVGKGLGSSKLETPTRTPPLAETPKAPEPKETKVTSVRTPEPHEAPAAAVEVPPLAAAPAVPAVPEEKAKLEEEPLKLVPKAGADRTTYGSLTEPSHVADTVLENPKIRAIVEDDPKPPRKITSLAKNLPPSFAMGKFTVQVGSYANARDAQDRVKRLKEFGFLHAYLSAKELGGDKNNTWYRVWLGYYPDYNSAKASGEALLQKNEIRNYLVRRTGADQ